MQTNPESTFLAPANQSPAIASGPAFVDRRTSSGNVGAERRQFASSHQGLSDEARALAVAIDQYKLDHRRRYITFEEMLSVIKKLGYRQGE